MSDLIERLRNSGSCPMNCKIKYDAADALEQANARERPAFMAGYEYADVNNTTADAEQAWQEYRCQDDTDWKAVEDETAKTIDTSVLETAQNATSVPRSDQSIGK